jgi:large subunit ribosomal protein L14e
VKTKWENSSWGKKLIVQKRRAALNDFDRFKVMLAKIKVRNLPVKCSCWSAGTVYIACSHFFISFCKQRGGAIRQELAKLKKASTA